MSGLTDAEYALADAVEAVLEAHPQRWWTPSQVGRRVGVDAAVAGRVLRWMAAGRYVRAGGNGAWTRYAAR